MENVVVRGRARVVGGPMGRRDFSNDFVRDEKGDGDDVGVVRGSHFKVGSGFKGERGEGEDKFVVLLRVLWSVVIGQHDLDLLGVGGACDVDAANAGDPLEEVVNGCVHF